VFAGGFPEKHPCCAGFDPTGARRQWVIWPPRCGKNTFIPRFGALLNRNRPQDERRKWSRLPLAIPVFVRSHDKNGKDLLEFATALNISATGALLAVRRSLPLSSQVLLEIPSVPLASTTDLPKSCRNLRAKTMWITHAETYQLVGLRFAQPLLNHNGARTPARRKVLSSV
jgi:hypothetical protein